MNSVTAIRGELLAAVRAHALRRPAAIALEGPQSALSYRELERAIGDLGAELRRHGSRRVALLADNGMAWALAELACLDAGLLCVPLPSFFSPGQIVHALRSAGIDTLLVDPRLSLPSPLFDAPSVPLDALPVLAGVLHRVRLPTPPAITGLHAGTCKITFTSGTTGEPKGVCLGIEEQQSVAAALLGASGADEDARHLCVLPLSTLLENIGGLYAPLLAGATTCVWPLADVGLSGASALNVHKLLEAIITARASSVILVPQMLLALVSAIEAGAPRPVSLRFIAVGGASVSPALLQRAIALGLPVFEGYGLSECASVVALNRADAQRPDTVGKPLPHVQISIAGDGEILVTGSSFRGYVGEAPRDRGQAVATGDIGYLDSDGFLHITGRKKNIFVTSFGRNVSPDWVERELCLHPAIAQAAVFGEAAPFNVAVIVARAPGIDAAIAAVNRELPDYARIRKWIAASAPFTPANDQGTANSRLRRAQIRAAYASQIESLYQDPPRSIQGSEAAPA
ncbi:MAG: Long-chain-fatty-acid--CoA ligase FadD15 [Hydrocarboniphaga sp.]|uniref:AMP-binding protein n=1 Tax=Hydrocarboniphaga sp. TaxID=2033016 RepID=UPI00262760F8|nr:AMP-binding protein [Hydrocarboniphaga sp.]MDB5972549.1 Long-chain-fatty-acid--CoA ligase FadD15 [Hydrocarboniphaga sp.]